MYPQALIPFAFFHRPSAGGLIKFYFRSPSLIPSPIGRNTGYSA